MTKFDTSTPVLLLAGQENTLSITRNLGRRGIDVRVSGKKSCWALYSRYCKKSYLVADDIDILDYWHNLLITPENNPLKGHIILACNDDALEFVIANREALEELYTLEEFDRDLNIALLDKQTTIDLAQKADVPAPKYWPVQSMEDIDALEGELELPVVIKPINSVAFRRKIGAKLLIAEESFDELRAHAARAFEHELEVMVVELIPGGDDQLCSYFTYITPSGDYLFDYTKSVIRRYPVGYGGGSCHITKWQPDVMEMGRRFFESTGFRGMGNIEFKRDGDLLKIIEVNTRFAGSHELITTSGAPIDWIVYCHLTGQEIPTYDTYDQGRYLWAPIADTLSFLQLRSQGKLTFSAWMGDILAHKITFPTFRITDPQPAIRVFMSIAGKFRTRILGKVFRKRGSKNGDKNSKYGQGPSDGIQDAIMRTSK